MSDGCVIEVAGTLRRTENVNFLHLENFWFRNQANWRDANELSVFFGWLSVTLMSVEHTEAVNVKL
jgi:hypothetical protein